MRQFSLEELIHGIEMPAEVIRYEIRLGRKDSC